VAEPREPREPREPKGPTTSTRDLTAALAAGDERAVERFYRDYFDWLLAQSRRASGRRDESFCLDVLQDAVLRVLRTVRAVESESQFRAWLKLVIQTAACDRLRSERRRQTHELAAAAIGAGQMNAAAASAADKAIGRDEQLAWLREQIAQLDPHLVQMIEWRFGQRWTLARISEKLGLSIGTIDGRLRRALRDLRAKAIEEFEECEASEDSNA